MSLQSKLREANLDNNAKIVLSYSTGADIIHAYDNYVDDVLRQTGFTDTVANVIAFPGFKNEAIQEMRASGECFLDGYERDGSGFDSFVSHVISENIYDFDFVDQTVEQYDYKRGFLTLEANVETTVGEVFDAPENLFSGWSTQVPTKVGVLKIDG